MRYSNGLLRDQGILLADQGRMLSGRDGNQMLGQRVLRGHARGQVDILKAKIKGAWGPMMEEVADAVIEAHGHKMAFNACQWQGASGSARESREDLEREAVVQVRRKAGLAGRRGPLFCR